MATSSKSVATGRKLKHIDLSEINIGRIDFNDFLPMCDSVEYLDVRKAVLGSVVNYQNAEPCESLRTLDIRGVVLPALRIFKFSFEVYSVICHTWNAFTFTENILIDNINTEHNIEINDYTLNMSICPLKVQNASLVGNGVRWINMTVEFHETTKKSFSELNLSYNGLEYISPSVFLQSENIRNLDLSNNKLNVMQEKYTQDFERLFWIQTKLSHLNLSHNRLGRIPRNTFLKNTLLQVLDISHNRVRYLDFSVEQFLNIEKLIVSHNKIQIIGHDFRMKLQVVLLRTTSHDDADDNGAFYVYLEANDCRCKCDKMNMQFIEWLHSAKVINKNEILSCSLEEDLVDVRGTGLADTKHFCRMQTIKRSLLISTPIVFITVTLGIVFIIFIQRHRKRKLMIREVISQIEMGTFLLPYLVFLLHCGEDTDLVMNKIYPELCKNLSEMTGSNMPLVCVGDKHFMPGFSLRCEVMRCVEESSVIVAIISRVFCGKTICNLEIKEAYEQNKPIIMLMVEYVEKQMMDDFLQKIFDRYVHATWKAGVNGGKIEPEWKLFCKSIVLLAGKSIATTKPVDMTSEI